MKSTHANQVERAKQGSITPSQMQVFKVVEGAKAGISKRDICKATGRSYSVASEIIYVLKLAGWVTLVSRSGNLALWCTPENKAATAKRAQKMEGHGVSAELARKKLLRNIKDKDRASRPLEDTPTVTVVDAAKAKPFKVYAPRSIFELATC